VVVCAAPTLVSRRAAFRSAMNRAVFRMTVFLF
jgi:hypothetical protein